LTRDWLWNAAAVVVLLCSLGLVAIMSWGVGRYSRRGGTGAVRAVRPAMHPIG
jgi:hypothetical protein